MVDSPLQAGMSRLMHRLRVLAQVWSTPQSPTPQQYWGDSRTTVGWWKAL